jgi:ABC-2 type transport system permease protein
VNATVTSITSRLRTEQTTGTFEMLVASPTPRAILVVGTALFDALLAMFWAAVMVVLAVLFLGVSLAPTAGSLAAAGVAIVASGSLFLAVGAALAGFTVVFKAAGGIVSIYVTAVGVLCGVYYPTSVLPAPLRALSDLIPLTWTVDVLRRALLDGAIEWGRLGLLVGAGLLAMPIGVLIFEAAVRRAMKAGTLAQY